MTPAEQLAKLQTDLTRLQKLAQDHHNAAQQHMGACQYIQGQIIELQQAQAAEAPKAPTP